MTALLDKDSPALFLGIADYVKKSSEPFPVGGLDLYQLAQHKVHIIYPGDISQNEWVILMRADFILNGGLLNSEIRINDENGSEIGKVGFENLRMLKKKNILSNDVAGSERLVISKEDNFVILNIKIDGMFVYHPGRYSVNFKDNIWEIGNVYFHYRKAPNLTLDQMKAIEAGPNSVQSIIMEAGCKFCPTRLFVYTGLKRQPRREEEGWVWYAEVNDEFVCQCGKVKYSLKYIKESMHGLLLKDWSENARGLSYVRQYAHSQIKRIVNHFSKLLDTETLEQPIQEFIEKNPVLLSRFHPKRLFSKPDIIGFFQADFALLDSKNQLVFIELEKPSLTLFKKNGHQAAGLTHAYEQVNDWLHKYSKFPEAILERLGLKPDQIVAVKGVVIAGRSASITHEALQRHLSNPPYPNIEFMTIDDLGTSLLTISKDLA